MRRPLPIAILVLLLAACENPSAPRDFSIVGNWISTGVDTLDVRFTLSETARTITGAGSWLTPSRAMAYRISGAHVARQISLLLEFDEGPDINFQGEFQESASDTLTLLTGRLYGGTYRGYPIVFVRREGSEN